MRASHLTSQMQIWAKPKPLYNRKRARVQGENPYILALFVFIDELMLTHHELASPWFLASLHELNCNQCADRHNSCRRQFMKAQLSIHATARLQFTRVFSVKDNTLNLPIFYYALFIMLTFKKSKSTRRKSLYSCSFRFYRWIDANASWIGFAMISRRRAAFSMNWIATNIMPPGQFTQFTAIHDT